VFKEERDMEIQWLPQITGVWCLNLNGTFPEKFDFSKTLILKSCESCDYYHVQLVMGVVGSYRNPVYVLAMK